MENLACDFVNDCEGQMKEHLPMKTGSVRMMRQRGSTLNFPLSVISTHSPFFLELVLQCSQMRLRTNLTVSSASASASLRLVSSALILTTICRQSLSGSTQCSTKKVTVGPLASCAIVSSISAASAIRRECLGIWIYYVCKCNIDQSIDDIQNNFEMKISLNQPNGFNAHFAPSEHKYLDARSENIEHAKSRFNPYVNNGGTVVAIAGDDFVVVGGDSRLSEGYSIVTRNESKLVQLTDKTVLATSGMYADFCELTKVLKAKLQVYDFKIERLPTTESIAHLLSKTLYGRRFFPYYTFNLVAGLDKNGKGVVYGYDAIGSYGSDKALAQGSGAHMILPFLDSEVTGYNDPKHSEKPALTAERAVDLVETAFRSAAERDIYTGDKLEILVVTKDGSRKEWRQLRRD